MKYKNLRKRLGAFALSVCMALSMTLPSLAADTTEVSVQDTSATYVDGTYEGSAQGYIGLIKISVTIKDGKIAEIKEVSQSETPAYWDMAKVLLDTITEKQTTEVDGISGATYSSNGIKNAVAAALELAKNGGSNVDFSFFASGDGSAQNPYVIETASQFQKFADSVSSYDYSGKYIQLAGDIDISGADWNPIGSESSAFNGTFDGANYAINGLTEGSADKARTFEANSIVGLFSMLGADAVLENIRLTNVSMNVYADGCITVGTLAGKSSGHSYTDRSGTVVNNCHVDGSLTVNNAGDKYSNVWAGGLLGYQLYGAVLNSSSDVDLYAGEATGSAWLEAGGIEGINVWGVMANCYATGDVTVSFYKEQQVLEDDQKQDPPSAAAGGLCGLEYGIEVNCYATGNITSTTEAECIGALQGSVVKGAQIYNCWYKTDARVVNGGKEIAVTDVSTGLNGEVVNNQGFTSDTYYSIVDGLNATVANYPLDTSAYGVTAADLMNWSVDRINQKVVQGQAANRIQDCSVSAIKAVTYTGKAKKPAVTVTVNGEELVEGTDYTVSYKNNVNAGKAKAVITGKGDFTGKKTVRFTIKKAAQKITVKSTTLRVKAGSSVSLGAKAKGKVTYTVSKYPAGAKNALQVSSSGKVTVKAGAKKGTYQIRVRAAATANYKKAVKTVTVKVS